MRLVVGYGVLHIKSSYRHICHAVARVAFVSDKSAGRSLSRCVSEAAVACFRFDTLTIRLWRPAVQPCRSVEDGTDSWNSTGGVGFGADAGAGVRWDGSSWNLDRTAGKSCLCALRQATEACLLLREKSIQALLGFPWHLRQKGGYSCARARFLYRALSLQVGATTTYSTALPVIVDGGSESAPPKSPPALS